MTAEAVERGKIDIARVIQQTFSVLGRNFVASAVLALVLVGLPTAVATALLPGAMSGDGLAFMLLFMAGLLSLVTTAVLQGALIYSTVQDLNGARASVADSLATGFRAFLPLIVVSFGFGLAVVFGLILLIVPGVMIACAWCVSIPSLVAERRGVRDAFSRSAELTRGNRWRIFALLLLWTILSMVVQAVFEVATGGQTALAAGTLNPVVVVATTVVAVINVLIGATGVAVLYVELRGAREGAGPQWLSEIFS